MLAARAAVIVVLMGLALWAMLALGEAPAAPSEVSVTAFQSLILSWGLWGVVASLGLMIIHCFLPFPAELVAVANGAVYGPVWGTAITWAGGMLGAALAFGLTRALGRAFVERLVPAHQQARLDAWVAREGKSTLFAARFLPIISFNLINMAAALTNIRWWTFLWVTGLGILPVTTAMVMLGDRMTEDVGPYWLGLFLLGAGLWGLLLGWYSCATRRSTLPEFRNDHEV